MPKMDMETIMALLSSGGSLTPEQVSAIYDDAVGEFRPILQMLPAFAPKLADDVSIPIEAILVLGRHIRNNDQIKSEVGLARKDKAAARKASLDAYIEVGFTPAQAFKMMMMDMANAKLVPQMVSESMKNMPASKSAPTEKG